MVGLFVLATGLLVPVSAQESKSQAPGKMVDIGGYQLYLDCRGKDRPPSPLSRIPSLDGPDQRTNRRNLPLLSRSPVGGNVALPHAGRAPISSNPVSGQRADLTNCLSQRGLIKELFITGNFLVTLSARVFVYHHFACEGAVDVRGSIRQQGSFLQSTRPARSSSRSHLLRSITRIHEVKYHPVSQGPGRFHVLYSNFCAAGDAVTVSKNVDLKKIVEFDNGSSD